MPARRGRGIAQGQHRVRVPEHCLPPAPTALLLRRHPDTGALLWAAPTHRTNVLLKPNLAAAIAAPPQAPTPSCSPQLSKPTCYQQRKLVVLEVL